MADGAVVRIFTTYQRPDYDVPWQTRPPSRKTGSGVVIGPRRILTGAHVVADATFIQIQKVSEPDKHVARLVGVCHDCDLALLEVEDPDFSCEVAQLADLPRLRDRVSVTGFPVGGEELSVTEGVVSRIEVQRYSHSQRNLLAITVDAAINSGNSGGPVFCDGKVVGIAFQSYSDAENIGEVVPSVLARRFIRAVDEGRSTEVPSLSIRIQNLENPMLRGRLGLSDDQSGVMVRTVEYGGSAWGALRHGDVLLGIGGHRVSNNGTVLYQDRVRTSYEVLLGERFVDDTIDVRVCRDGAVHDLALTLRPRVRAVPRNRYDRQPTYFVYGGLVFQPLTRNFLQTWETWWQKAPTEFIQAYYAAVRQPDHTQVIVLTQVLADELTVGYAERFNELIATVNGVVPRDMAHLVMLLEGSVDHAEILTTWDARIVLDVEAVREAHARILACYRIAEDRSADLR